MADPPRTTRSLALEAASVGRASAAPPRRRTRVPHEETPRARRARIRQLFERLDSSGAGRIDVAGLGRQLELLASTDATETDDAQRRRLLQGACEMYARELAHACDGGDGQITFDAFEKFVHEKEAQLWRAFCAVDSANSSVVGGGQLRRSLDAAGLRLSDAVVDRFLEQIDQRGDGVIDFEEWRDFFLLLPRQATLENLFEYYQALYDVDMNVDQVPVAQAAAPRTPATGKSAQTQYFISGAVSGAVSRTATAPLDRIKVYLQMQTSGAAAESSAGRGIWAAVRRVYLTDGLVGFYRGNALNVLKVMPESAIKFMVFEHAKQLVQQREKSRDKDHISVTGRFIAGGAAGLCSQFCIYPVETIKTRVMAQYSAPTGNAGKPASTSSVVWRTCAALWRENGVRGFFRGCTPALVGIVPYAGIDFAVFETLKHAYMRRQLRRECAAAAAADSEAPMPTALRPPSVLAVLGCGMVSGTAGVVAVYPISLLRTRMQAQGTPSHPARYASSWDVVRRAYAAEGLRGFYKGLTPTLIKVVPAVSIGYLAYEQTKRQLGLG